MGPLHMRVNASGYFTKTRASAWRAIGTMLVFLAERNGKAVMLECPPVLRASVDKPRTR
jgi:hypothetical protein